VSGQVYNRVDRAVSSPRVQNEIWKSKIRSLGQRESNGKLFSVTYSSGFRLAFCSSDYCFFASCNE
jgi:hypothetical protein